MYPGINGKTHGDKKLIIPAKKAIDNEVFIQYILLIPFLTASIYCIGILICQKNAN